MNVGRVYSTTMNQPSGITEVLLEKTQRELDEALKRVKDCGSHMIQVCKELEAGEMDCAIDAAITVMGRLKQSEKESERLKNFADNVHAELLEARKENEEQARLLGSSGSREARLTAERDHYKQALAEIFYSINEWNESMVKEPADDLVAAINNKINSVLNG